MLLKCQFPAKNPGASPERKIGPNLPESTRALLAGLVRVKVALNSQRGASLWF